MNDGRRNVRRANSSSHVALRGIAKEGGTDRANVFHVERGSFKGSATRKVWFHVKPSVKSAINQRSLEWVEYQTAEQLGEEIGALGRHPLTVLADFPHMVDRGRHDQRGKLELV